MLWLLENLIISAYNYLAQGDYSSVTKFQNGHPAFFECFLKGSNKRDRRKFNYEKNKRL